MNLSFIRRYAVLGIRWFLGVLGGIEQRFTSDRKLDCNPIFIIGPLRSGTTLVYQYLCHVLEVSPPTNLLVRCRLFRAPLTYKTLAGIVRLFTRDRNSDFKNEYGKTSGILSPNEAGELWYQWLPGGKYYLVERDLNEKRKMGMFKDVSAIETIQKGPFLNKNTWHSIRIRYLREAFPNSLFIDVQRDPLFIAQSIYRARIGRYRSRDWIGVRPLEIAELKKMDLVDQCCGQAVYIRKTIDEDRDRLDDKGFFTVNWEEFCEAPSLCARRIADFLDENGVTTPVKVDMNRRFSNSNVQRVSDEVFSQMKSTLERMNSDST